MPADATVGWGQRARQAVRAMHPVVGHAAASVAYLAGMDSIYGLLGKPKGAIVLMYHSVWRGDSSRLMDPYSPVDAGLFDEQLAFLSSNRRVVPLEDLMDAAARGISMPSGTVAITLDDAYLDNLTVAAPLLAKHGLPATLFVPTGYVSRQQTHWTDELHQLSMASLGQRVDLPLLDDRGLDVATSADQQRLRRVMHAPLLTAKLPRREALLDQLRSQLPASTGTTPRLTMNWDELRQMRKEFPLMSVGGHSRDHLDLRTNDDDDTAKTDIAGCLTDLQDQLGETPKVFSFPYGRWSERSRHSVKQMGWTYAIGAGTELRIGAWTDRFVIPRVDTPRDMISLKYLTSSFYPGLLRRMRLA